MNPTPPDGPSVCGKQNCNRPARAALTFDYRERTVWLDDVGPDADVRAAFLCAACADGFKVPLGWQLLDRMAPEAAAAPPEAVFRSPAHPAVAARGRHEPGDLDPSMHLGVPDEEHPSGPLDLRARNEPKAVTLELERLARHLDTIPSPPASPPDPEAAARRPGIAVRPARPPVVAGAPDLDDEDTFGDTIDDLTEELSVVGFVDAIWADEETQIEPPRWADPA